MTLYKKGTCSSSVVISSSVYACTSCDHTEIVESIKTAKSKKCPKCSSKMRLISSQAEIPEEKNEEVEKED